MSDARYSAQRPLVKEMKSERGPASSPDEDPLNWLKTSLAAWRTDDLYRGRRLRTSPQGPEIEIDGRPLLNFASNDYLGLANDDRILAAAVAAVNKHGWGAGASPLIVGHDEEHRLLENETADFLGTEAALVFSSGYAANCGTIPALVGRGDFVFSDAHNHASIIDGCRLSRAEVVVFAHNNVDDLRVKLDERRTHGGRRLIVVDSLFSMDGDLAPLTRLAELSKQYGAMLMIDEAHAVGVFGERGARRGRTFRRGRGRRPAAGYAQ